MHFGGKEFGGMGTASQPSLIVSLHLSIAAWRSIDILLYKITNLTLTIFS